MLEEIHVHNYGVLKDVHLELGTGLVVITGETGAGKTLLIRALESVFKGGKNPQAESLVETLWSPDHYHWPTEWNSEQEAQVSLGRRWRNGKSQSLLWGVTVRKDTLPQDLYTLTSQGAGIYLKKPSWQRHFLDTWSKVNLAKMQTLYENLQTALKSREAAYQALHQAEKEREGWLETVELLSSVSGEEYIQLKSEREQMTNQVHHAEARSQALGYLSGEDWNLPSLARQASHTLEASYPEWSKELIQAAESLDQVLEGILGYEDDDFNMSFEALEQQIHKYERLVYRYGDPETWEDTYEHAKDNLDTDWESELAAAEHIYQQALTAAQSTAQQISAKRRKSAPQLIKKLDSVLKDLGLEGTQPSFKFIETELTIHGIDRVELVWDPNGLGQVPIGEGASGGELSRLCLASSTLYDNLPPLLIYDEIDAGVGGHTIHKIADLLADLAQRHQIIVITHHPLVAVQAKQHLRAHKEQGQTVIEILSDTDREQELTRMLGAQPDDHELVMKLLAQPGARQKP